MLKIGIGQAEDIDTVSAVEKAVARCKSQLGDTVPNAGIVFAGVEFYHKLMLREIKRHFPDIELVGCTSSGELSSDYDFSDDSVNLMLIASDTIEIAAGIGTGVSINPEKAAKEALHSTVSKLKGKHSLCLTFPDGAASTSGDVISTLNRELKSGCPVIGGSSSRQWDRDLPTRQFYGDRVYRDALPLMIFSGPIEYAFSISHSWRPVGIRSWVSEARGRKIFRIGDMTAIEFYRYYLGPHSYPAYDFPLAVFDDSGYFCVRVPRHYNEKDGSIDFSAPISEKSPVQLTFTTRDRVIDETRISLQEMMPLLTDTWHPKAAFAFSCTARKQILGTRTPEELRILKEFLPAGVPVFGFYSSGEFCPVKPEQGSLLHNCTLVTLVIGEQTCDPGHLKQSKPQALPVQDRKRGKPSYADLHKENIFLKRKLVRSENYRMRLEHNKEYMSALLRKVNRDISAARREIQRKNELLRESLALAEEVQQNLLPKQNPLISCFDIAGESIYCSETGGDYYDFLPVPEGSPGRFSVVVGDVTDHGISAALLMTTARALIRSRVLMPGTMSDIVEDINRHLSWDVYDTGRFMTLMFLTVDPEHGVVYWVRAGHDPAIYYDPEKDEFKELKGKGIALGVDPYSTYKVYREDGLRKGHVIVLGTDGIWETHNAEGEMFGKEPLYRIIRNNADKRASEIQQAVFFELDRFRGGREPEDDITLVVIRVDEDLGYGGQCGVCSCND